MARRPATLDIQPAALPGSGDIALSQVIAEFGKGNNMLDYLGEGGVTATPPLKLTDFYGTSAGPPAIHSYSGLIHNNPNPGKAPYVEKSTVFNLSQGDVVIEGGHYTYGLNSNPGGLDCNKSGNTTRQSGYGTQNSMPLRVACSTHIISSNNTSQTFTFTGQGDSTYWPIDFESTVFIIPKANLPFDPAYNIRGATAFVGGYPAETRNGMPNSTAIGIGVAVNSSSAAPTVASGTGVVGTITRPTSGSGSHTTVYQLVQLDGNGRGETDIVFNNAYIQRFILLYSSPTRLVDKIRDKIDA